MNISFGEILIIVLVALLFYKPSEIRAFMSSLFKMKKDIENDIHSISHEKVEFFQQQPNNLKKEIYFEKEECPKQQ